MLSFATLDLVTLVPFDCLYNGSFDHLDALLIESLVPLGLLVIAQVFTSMHWLHSHGGKHHQVLSAWLTMLFLVLPVISRTICSSFRCDAFDGGDLGEFRYLSSDTSLNCDTARYEMMIVFALANVLVYPLGCPLLLLVILFKFKGKLNPGDRPESEVIAQRKEDPELAAEPVTHFSMLYRPAYWWYEVYNMLRRLMLTCAVLLCNDLAETTVLVISVAVVTLVIEEEAKAYLNPFLTAFTHTCCWQIVLFALYLLLLDAQVRWDSRGGL